MTCVCLTLLARSAQLLTWTKVHHFPNTYWGECSLPSFKNSLQDEYFHQTININKNLGIFSPWKKMFLLVRISVKGRNHHPERDYGNYILVVFLTMCSALTCFPVPQGAQFYFWKKLSWTFIYLWQQPTAKEKKRTDFAKLKTGVMQPFLYNWSKETLFSYQWRFRYVQHFIWLTILKLLLQEKASVLFCITVIFFKSMNNCLHRKTWIVLFNSSILGALQKKSSGT